MKLKVVEDAPKITTLDTVPLGLFTGKVGTGPTGVYFKGRDGVYLVAANDANYKGYGEKDRASSDYYTGHAVWSTPECTVRNYAPLNLAVEF